jgi:hypothetical protein
MGGLIASASDNMWAVGMFRRIVGLLRLAAMSGCGMLTGLRVSGRRRACALRGHHMAFHFEPDRLSLRCLTCGAETPGWTLDIRPAFRSPRRQIVASHRIGRQTWTSRQSSNGRKDRHATPSINPGRAA